MTSITKEVKIAAAIRQKPGDNWKCIFKNANKSVIFKSLTECLEHIYQKTEVTQFFLDSKLGVVSIVEEKIIEKEVKQEKRWSLYGDT